MTTMKTTLLLFSVFLFALAIECSPAVAQTAPEAVRDTAGDELQTGTEYYILPVFRGSGGGLTLTRSRNNSCPLDVAQERHEVNRGLPLTFTPVDPSEGVIRVSTDLNIQFSAVTICVQSTVWQLKDLDESTGQRFVTTGGVEGNPGPGTLTNWFKIEKTNDDHDFYKLVFCPTVCDICRPICGDIGIFFDDGVRRLALSDNPFLVMFGKV